MAERRNPDKFYVENIVFEDVASARPGALEKVLVVHFDVYKGHDFISSERHNFNVPRYTISATDVRQEIKRRAKNIRDYHILHNEGMFTL